MRNRQSDDAVERVRDANDIVSVVGGYVRLRKAGRNYKGLCPFHKEKTPSFIVTPERQTFHCFGCGKGGDVFRFVMEMDGVQFPEALRSLAARGGVALESTWKRKDAGERERRLKVLDFACRLFEKQLRSKRGAAAAEYVERRGFRDETVALFRIGYAPDSWRFLRDAAARKGIADADLIDTGLIIPKEGGSPYDRFRDRLIFPIGDPSGRIIGFGGRVMGDGEPKYLNSPETPLFRKGEALYGIDRSRGEIHRAGYVLLVEGYTDVIALYQDGIRNVVAPLGTALTPGQGRMLSHYTDRVVLLFDGDEAGVKAAVRSLATLAAEGLAADVALLPPGSDPDQYLREEGRSAMEELIASASSFVSFLLHHPFPGGREEAVRTVIGVLAAVDDEIRLGLLVRETNRMTGLREEVLLRRIRAERAGAKEEDRPALRRSPGLSGRLIDAQRGIAFLGLEHPDLLPVIRRVIRPEKVDDIPARKLLKALYECDDSGARPTPSLLTLSGVDREFSRLRVETEDVDDPLAILHDYILCVREEEIERRSRKIQAEIRDAEERNDEAACSRLLVQRSELAALRRNLAHATKGDSTGAEAAAGERSDSPR